MSIEVINEGGLLRVVRSSEPIPDGCVVRLHTEDEIVRFQAGCRTVMDVQMPAFIRGDEEEDASDLFEIPVR